MIEFAPGVLVAPSALHWAFSRSSGPGGQHVNKTATRVQLTLCLNDLVGLNEGARQRLFERLQTRIDTRQCICVVAQSERSQLANRESALANLVRVISAALHQPRKRKATKPTKGSRKRRLDAKHHQGALKQQRRGGVD